MVAKANVKKLFLCVYFKELYSLASLIHFKFFSYFCGKCHWNFDRDCIESVDHFGCYVCFINTNSSNPRT